MASIEQLEADKEYNAQLVNYWRNLLRKHLAGEPLTEEEERHLDGCRPAGPSRIRVTSAGRERNWYADHVNEEFDVERIERGFFVVRNPGGRSDVDYSVSAKDCAPVQPRSPGVGPFPQEPAFGSPEAVEVAAKAFRERRGLPEPELLVRAVEAEAERDSLRSAIESWQKEEEDWKRREAELLDEVTRLTIERNGARSLRDALKMQARLDASRLLDQEAEVERLQGWLQKIDGGDAPCEDARQLRQWAYEAITLRRQP